jgi:hypothetical protein
MEKWLVMSFCLAAILCTALPAQSAFNGDSFVRAGIPEAARLISRLEQARHIDRMNEQGYMGGVNRDAGMLYYQKSQEVDALLKRLGKARPCRLTIFRAL